VTLSLFAGGCLLGLALFSRLLRWLLQAAPNRTYAALLGLMLGSLRRLWPLQAATPATAALPFKEREWELIAPTDWAGPILPLLGLLAGAFVVVLWAEQWGLRNTVDELAPATADASDEEGPVAG
jgi:putative membrane protein